MQFGHLLHEARERRYLSLEEVEQAIKIRRKYLAALEAEDLRSLPPPAYARGFLRNYAEYLGLDAEAILALYPVQPDPVSDQTYLEMIRPPTRHFGRWIPVIIVIPLLFLTGAYLLGSREGNGQPSDEPAAAATLQLPAPLPTLEPAATSTPTPKPTATATRTPNPERVVIAIKVLAPSWVALVVDGKEDFSGTLNAGETRDWQARDTLTLHTRNAGGLEITFNGKRQPLLGSSGQELTAEWGPAGFTIITPTPAPTSPPPPPAPPTRVPPTPGPPSPTAAAASPAPSAAPPAEASPTAAPGQAPPTVGPTASPGQAPPPAEPTASPVQAPPPAEPTATPAGGAPPAPTAAPAAPPPPEATQGGAPAPSTTPAA